MAKAVDCVEMKHEAQASLLASFQAQRTSYSSYAEFIRETAAADPDVRAFKERVAEARTGADGDTAADPV